jgi:hypothetical protein
MYNFYIENKMFAQIHYIPYLMRIITFGWKGDMPNAKLL